MIPRVPQVKRQFDNMPRKPRMTSIHATAKFLKGMKQITRAEFFWKWSMFLGEKEYFAWEFNSLPQPSLCSIFRLMGSRKLHRSLLTLNGINILLLASALRMGVLKEVDKTYMKK